jgi:hypothetical protein
MQLYYNSLMKINKDEKKTFQQFQYYTERILRLAYDSIIEKKIKSVK